MEIVTGALPSVITKLGELLVGEYNLQKGVKGDIMFLQSELDSMKGALEKVSNTPPERLDIQDKIWARDLRELSYDIEDTIDTFMVRGNSDESGKLHGIKKFVDRSVRLFRKAKIRHGIATEISDIKSRVVNVHERRLRYNVNSGVDKTTTTTMVDPRLIAQFKEAKELVGIDEMRDELIKVLMDGNGVPFQQGKIVSIVGFGGLGKTTLAKAVYEKIRARFDSCAFISVSQTPDLKKLFKELLFDLDKNINAGTMDERQLIIELREFLKLKRYIIVIDDLWDLSIWNLIKYAFPNNDVGYIVITTTRHADVAQEIGAPYNMKPLSKNNSKKLLYTKVFGSENIDNIEKCPDVELVEVSDKILHKCAGVPLAIITMASLLASKARNKMDWYEVYHSIGTGLEHNLDVENMRNILSLSYYNMPSHLRTCLLYLGMFPEDYKVEKDRLIWMWIAEGFIKSEKGKSQFEVGEDYFNQLINRSMTLPIYGLGDIVDGCLIHDMVLDLICSLSSESNFVTILNGMEQMSPSTKIRRLSIQNGKEDDSMTLATMSLQQVRSVVVLQLATSQMPVLGSFQVLRVMDLHNCDLSHGYSLNKFLRNLFHLRYLGLRNTCVVELPEEIGNLQFLQTLDIRDNKIACLPSNIIQLKHLMCLNIEWPTRMPQGFGSLTCLEKLSRLMVDESNIDILAEEFDGLTKLRVLDIVLVVECKDKLVECLRKLEKIQYLSIWSSPLGGRHRLDAWVAPRHLRSLDTQQSCWFSTLPAWMNPSHLPNLSRLSIAIGELQQAGLDILGRLPALRALILLVGHEHLGILGGFVVAAGSFPRLRHCTLQGFIGPVVFQHGAMPSLTMLEQWLSVRGAREIARSCGGGLDIGLGNLASLQLVSVELSSVGRSDEQVMNELSAALSHATNSNPNHPLLAIHTRYPQEHGE